MALSDADLDGMTLKELEALARRFGAAVETIREAQSLLGQGALPARPPITPPRSELSPGELVEREKLLRQFRHDGLSDAIRAAEEAQ